MEAEFNSYNFGITYKEWGYLDMPDVDALISEKNLDAANSEKVALLWKLHPARQEGGNVNKYKHERIEGLNKLLISSHAATRYQIRFEVTINQEKGIKKISRDIYRILTYQLGEKFGGRVTHLPDAVCKYQIVLFLCSACRTGIANDGTFTPLWKFVQNILKVPLATVHIAPASPEHQDWFERFAVVRGPEEPPGSSEYEEEDDEEIFGDAESVVSIYDATAENMDFFLG